ncbi:DUF6326 family protein [Epilithonimonas pallida]|uniref:Uncharacterized protein n=1 Tax=Epilithonimonas pallida TaxID=373671 RepID=A0ABY1R6S8_9FLAO|nr:DUF6326 family protein [Epilithonimonas pallida]SMP97067.1 hypothetical protein SAMN05421679_11146 [Epilithonimonas pallida]
MKTELQDHKINIKLQLSALWTGVMFLYIYGDYFELYVPGKINGLLNGQNMLDNPGKLFLATVLLAIPALLIFLNLMLKANFAKWLNIIWGLFFSVFTLLVGISSLSAWKTFYVFLAFLESLVTAIIVYKSWNWPKSI